MKKKQNSRPLTRALTRPRRHRSIGCRVTDEEFESFRIAAESLGMTPSEGIRFAGFSCVRINPMTRAILEQGEWLRYVLGNFLLHLCNDGKYPSREALKEAAALGDEHKVDRADAIIADLFAKLRETVPPSPKDSGGQNA